MMNQELETNTNVEVQEDTIQNESKPFNKKWLFIIPLIVLLSITTYLVFKFISKTRQVKSIPDHELIELEDKTIREYILKYKDSYSMASIEKALLKAGMPVEKVDKVMTELK